VLHYYQSGIATKQTIGWLTLKRFVI